MEREELIKVLPSFLLLLHVLRTYTFLLSLKSFYQVAYKRQQDFFNYAYKVRKFWSMTLDTASSAVCGGKMQKWIVLARVRHHVGRDESVLEGSVVMNDDEARAGLSHPYHIKRFFCFSLALAPSTSSSLMLAFDRHWWQQKPTSSGNSVASAALALYFPLSDQSYVNIVF